MQQIERLRRVLHECDKHLMRMNSAHVKMTSSMPLDPQNYLALQDDQVEHIDQYLFRFSKLQDAMGQKLFKTLLVALAEDVENKPFIDILNRLEKLEVLSVEKWNKLRAVRNEIAHNYEDDPESSSVAINKIYECKEDIETIYTVIRKYAFRYFTL